MGRAMAPPEEMGFKFIQQVQQRESRGQNLTKLPADFFDMLAQHIEHLRKLARDEVAKDPMSTTATLLQNELRSTLRLAQDIVSLRLRKMANRAVDSLEGGKVDLRSLTPGERDVYAEMARIVATARDRMTPPSGGAPGGTKSPGPAAPPPPTEPPHTEDSAEASADGPHDAPSAPTPEDPGELKALVHVLEDVPSFAGEGGRTYSLKRGDLVTLPEKLADVLVDKGMAERVDRSGG